MPMTRWMWILNSFCRSTSYAVGLPLRLAISKMSSAVSVVVHRSSVAFIFQCWLLNANVVGWEYKLFCDEIWDSGQGTEGFIRGGISSHYRHELPRVIIGFQNCCATIIICDNGSLWRTLCPVANFLKFLIRNLLSLQINLPLSFLQCTWLTFNSFAAPPSCMSPTCDYIPLSRSSMELPYYDTKVSGQEKVATTLESRLSSILNHNRGQTLKLKSTFKICT